MTKMYLHYKRLIHKVDIELGFLPKKPKTVDDKALWARKYVLKISFNQLRSIFVVKYGFLRQIFLYFFVF